MFMFLYEYIISRSKSYGEIFKRCGHDLILYGEYFCQKFSYAMLQSLRLKKMVAKWYVKECVRDEIYFQHKAIMRFQQVIDNNKMQLDESKQRDLCNNFNPKFVLNQTSDTKVWYKTRQHCELQLMSKIYVTRTIYLLIICYYFGSICQDEREIK
eukprot:TRINITY_DN49346_c0_g2_i1.p2 TRINITY_DN49346_c0_g2~~TRINITY_DN49346_c0_g2_i1.p2  ORF type:complete len:155 (+),score=3.98 TRINITY_DN49346_c0_g2_i1:81-545(+)